jgi:hypothetical protein
MRPELVVSQGFRHAKWHRQIRFETLEVASGHGLSRLFIYFLPEGHLRLDSRATSRE